MEKECRDKECQMKVLLPKVGEEGMEMMVQSLSLKQGVLSDRSQCTVLGCSWLQTVIAGWCVGEVQWCFLWSH